jgi:hypothetical protein
LQTTSGPDSSPPADDKQHLQLNQTDSSKFPVQGGYCTMYKLHLIKQGQSDELHRIHIF